MIVYRKIYEYLDNKEKNELNRLIDYTKISDNLSNDDIKKICQEAEENNFYSVCVQPKFIATAHSFLRGEAKVCALIDYPNGESSITDKKNEIDKCTTNGAKEVDVVINYNLIKKPEEHEDLEKEIREISEYCHKEGIIFKAIIEIGALNFQQMEEICNMCIDGNADFVMTSTGKLKNDNSFEEKLEKVIKMRKILPDSIGIKFSGGIRSLSQIKELSPFIDRVGTSSIIN